jgi:hypothetical protein
MPGAIKSECLGGFVGIGILGDGYGRSDADRRQNELAARQGHVPTAHELA